MGPKKKTDASPTRKKKTKPDEKAEKKMKRSPKAEKKEPPSKTVESSEEKKDTIIDPSLIPFEAGRIFSRYDTDKDGTLNKHEFTELVKNNPELMRGISVSVDAKQQTVGSLPTELISNKVLTHYDETAGVAISRSELEQHRNMGSTVTPLVDAYKARYDRLRIILTGKLLPKREHLLQLRRQLQNCSVEVDAKRRSIERETLTDTEQILERLRNVESMRQSSIKHQILQIEDDLQGIERLVRRVEQANIDDNQSSYTTGVLLTSANPSVAPVEAVRIPKALNMVELIHQFSELYANIGRLTLKPITVQVDFPTDDFPKETSERLEILSRCDKYMHAINIKDHMLWTVLQEKDKLDEQLQDERKLSHDYAQEVSQWAEMSQELTKQIMILKQENTLMERRNRDMLNILKENNIYYIPNNNT